MHDPMTMILGAFAEVLMKHDRDIRPPRAEVAQIERRATALPTRWQRFKVCIIHRESGGNPHALNREESGAAGLFQFMPNWRHGGPYMVARALKFAGASSAYARKVRLGLPYRIEQWAPVHQEMLFAQVIREGGASAAYRHWHGGSGCNSLIPVGG